MARCDRPYVHPAGHEYVDAQGANRVCAGGPARSRTRGELVPHLAGLEAVARLELEVMCA